MIKPLLRVIPKLSGNVKLACNLFDFNKVKLGENIVYEANVRYAKLLPLSSHLFQKKIDAGLLGSCWDFDLKKFYETYSDIFYNNCFNFSKDSLLQLDTSKTQYVRNTDMEFGVKRISYRKSGSQFSMFAPIYIDDVNDIPSYFLLNINLSNEVYNITKTIKINLACNGESRYNYLYKYLKKYVKQIDDNVLFCQPENNQGIYYGIDLRNGGFTKAIDNTIGNVYNVQNTIHNFDSLVTRGFERNKIAMKQIIPLAFYFNINEIMTPQELHRYKNQIVSFSGAYYTDKNKKLPFYDFSIDYDEFRHQILKMHPEYGTLTYQDGNVSNIMDVEFPSLNEARYINYQFANKLSADFCRWKLKYSDDEHPYIMNMSWAFSKNANSNYRYGEFPVNLHQLQGICEYSKRDIKNNEYNLLFNLLFPISKNKNFYDEEDPTISQEFELIMNEYCLNWFNVIPRVDDSIFANSEIWRDTKDDCVYYNGILYDLQYLYNTKENPEKVDKFAMLIQPDVKIHTMSELTELKFSEYTMYRHSINTPNPNINYNVLDMVLSGKNSYLFTKEDYNYMPKEIPQNRLTLNEIYSYAYSDGNFVDIADIGLDYYELNKYYDYDTYYEKLKEGISYIFETYLNENTRLNNIIKAEYTYTENLTYINGFLNVPIYVSKMISYSNAYIPGGEIPFLQSYYVLNVPNLNSNSYLKDYFTQNFYYRSINDPIDKFEPAYIQLKDNNDYYYLTSGDIGYKNDLYGNNWYVMHKFLKASYVNEIESKDLSLSNPVMYNYIKRLGYIFPGWDVDEITNPANYDSYGNITYIYDSYGNITNQNAYNCCHFYKDCNEYKKKIGSYVIAYTNNLYANEYINNVFEFVPISEHNGEVYALNTFKERSAYTSYFYGDNIPKDKVNQDIDVLWADIYNLRKVFNKFVPYDRNYPNRRKLNLDGSNSKEFYVRFLNKNHIYYYYIELFKDENHDYTNYILIDNKKPNEEKALSDETGKNTLNIEYPINYGGIYGGWFIHEWYKTIYKKRKVWIYDTNYSNHPVVRIVYESIGEKGSFIEWFNSIHYDVEKDIFYTETKQDNGEIIKDYFELVFTRTMYRVNKILWDITDITNTNNEKYRDIYFYRLQQPQEYDSKYSDIMKIEFVDNVNSIANNIIMEHDSCLIPMFDDIFKQSEAEAQIVVHYNLGNINVCNITGDDKSDPDTLVNYRYNKNDKKMMIEVSEEEKKKYNITKTWKHYDETYNEFVNKYDDLGYSDSNFNTYVDPKTGIKYGFYIIRSIFNNTSNSFRLTGIIDNNIGDKVSKEKIYNLKYFHILNGVNLLNINKEDQQNYIVSIYKQISPFINLKPLNMLNYINTIVYPKNYSINLRYSQYLNNNNNGSNEVDIKKHNVILKNLSLYRYMHNMTPLITETTKVKNEYKLKLKNVKASILDTSRYNSIGDSPIYKEDSYINVNEPLKIYGVSNDKETKNYNNIVGEYVPLESKHFNCSRMVNLEEKIIIESNKKFRYKELLEAQSIENTIHIFKNYINRGHINQFNDNEILFLINKYNIEYDSTSVGLTLDKSEKLYTLKYVFTLL